MFKTYLFFAGFTEYLALQLCKEESSFNGLYGRVPLVEFWKRETGNNYSLMFDQPDANVFGE